MTHKADVGKRSMRPSTAVGRFSSLRKAREMVLQLTLVCKPGDLRLKLGTRLMSWMQQYASVIPAPLK